MEDQGKSSIWESLIAEGIVTSQELEKAKEEETRTGERLGTVLAKMGVIKEEDLVSFLSCKLAVPRIDLSNYLIDPKVIEFVPEELARKYKLIPVLKIGNRLTCAMVDPCNIFALDEIRERVDLIVEPGIATEEEIKKAIDEQYGAKSSLEEMIKSIDIEKDKGQEYEDRKGEDVNDLKVIAEEPGVIQLVNLTLMKAIYEGASDIHIEPEEEEVKIRFRVDGVLREVSNPPKNLQPAIISRIKILSNLDISERRVPQDGRFNIKIEGKEVDIRVSCVPTVYGENVVLRLLDASTALIGLNQIGFSEGMLKKYQKLISQPHGIILVTGPTGSGKTTTLYAALDKINTVDKNIITIEDPVEYKLAGIRQIQVNPKVSLSFANGLRSILRQDPDVIMVGEIRDFETAEIAIHAALTGHLVFSTLHTNDAPSSIMRLVDMGIEPFLISSSIIGIMAQRLVRTICSKCREKYVPSSQVLKDFGLNEKEKGVFFRGKGCQKCMDTGYKGRIGIFELMIFDDNIRDLAVAKASLDEVRKQAIKAGMVILREDGLRLIREGVTTIEEVVRVTQQI
jgi:type IV pilus assembly protein PilB